MSAMEVVNLNNVKIYTIASSSKSAIPDWLAQSKKKQLRDDPNWSQRIQLLQDFGFPEASIRLKQTRDKQHIIATGLYKPQVRVFDLANAGLKFDRHYDCENVQFEILSDDWKKFVMLQSDRSIEFHSQYGVHYKTRIPKFGRDMKYHASSCDLLIGGAGSEVYRLNLDQGRFLNPLQTKSSGINCVDINPANELWAFGGEDSHLEMFDHRSRSSVGRLNCGASVVAKYGADSFASFPEVSALSFMDDGLTYGVGLSTGQVLLYDLRSTKPLLIKDHQYEYPIKKISFHSSGNVMSADTKVIKMWDRHSGELYTSIEPENDINDVLLFEGSGLIMSANEGPNMNIFFCPSLGPAPKWCSFLDSLTEELEESTSKNVWDDYKFVSKRDLGNLGLEHLIGTKMLKAYMHGFFVDMRLYEKARAVANPFAYDEYKRRMVKDKIEKEQQSRISATRKLPKINKNAASRMLAKVEGKLKKEGEGAVEADVVANPTGDNRFADMFTNADFEIDEFDPEFVKFHTGYAANRDKQLKENFNKVQDSSDSEKEGQRSDEESVFGGESDDDDGNDSDASDELLPKKLQKKQIEKKNAPAKKGPDFYEIEDGKSWNSMQQGGSVKPRGKPQSFAARLKSVGSQNFTKSNKSRNMSGAMAMTFQPKSGKKSGGGRSGSASGGGASKPRTLNKNKRSAAGLR